MLKVQKAKIEEMEAKILNAKMTYNEALRKLEEISEEIHKVRQQMQPKLEEFNLDDAQAQMPTSTKTTTKNKFGHIDSTTDDYLVFPSLNLSLKAKDTTSQKQQLLRGFNLGASGSKIGCERNDDSDGDNMISPNQTDMVK